MLFIAIALITLGSRHDPNCDSPVSLALIACEAAKLERQDKAMNTEYRSVMAKMKAADADYQPDGSTDPSYSEALLASQRAWLIFRDAECRSEGYKYRGGSMEGMEVLGCKAALTKARVQQLHDLIKEE